MQLVHNEFSAEGHGLGGYICHRENDMKKARGAMASLVQKGIVDGWDDETGDEATWGCLNVGIACERVDGLYGPDPWAEYGFVLKDFEVVV